MPDILVSTTRTATSSKAIASAVDTTPLSSTHHEAALEYPKPNFPMAFLMALALKNSHTGCLLTSEIYSFISQHFPYFRTASENWKHNIRSSLTGRKHFVKIGCKNSVGNTKYSWKMDPSKIIEIDKTLELLLEQSTEIREAMGVPENFAALMRGELKHGNICDETSAVLDDTDNLKPTDTSIDGNETVQAVAEFDKPDDEFDEVGIYDSKFFQYSTYVEDGQAEYLDYDLQPMEKRTRLDL